MDVLEETEEDKTCEPSTSTVIEFDFKSLDASSSERRTVEPATHDIDGLTEIELALDEQALE